MKKFQFSLLRSPSAATSPLVLLPSSSLRSYSTYRVKIKRTAKPSKENGTKQHHVKSFSPKVDIPESTPDFFEHPDFKRENRYLVSRIDILNMGKTPSNIPKVQELTNSQWQEQMKNKVSLIFLSNVFIILLIG